MNEGGGATVASGLQEGGDDTLPPPMTMKFTAGDNNK